MAEVNRREIVERSGGVFLRVQGDGVYFRDPARGKELSVYLFACNDANVRLSLKNTREWAREFHELKPTNDLRF